MATITSPPIPALRRCLLNLSQPITKRTIAAFHLRTLGTPEAVAAVAEGLLLREDGALMRHELAYILGQMRSRDACPVLTAVLEDESDDILVRHECAEALGSIGHSSSLAVLEKYSKHSATEISETCQIAVELINWKLQQEAKEAAKGNQITQQRSLYLSFDPAPPLSEMMTIVELERNLLDSSLSLFHRYRAMFSLRDVNSDQAALALVSGFKDKSALFRHEVAFVLGQMQRPVTIPGLAEILKNKSEHRMVRSHHQGKRCISNFALVPQLTDST
jgi:deoxyhypusine monooxygenase